jgi:Domain of unknown function (DUF4372)
MYVGKTLFAQIMEFVPWTSFARIVQRYSGNAGVRTLSCAEQFRAMAFAQLTWRESLRDIEASLSANANKLYAMGFRSAVKRSTLADANESRDWRIWSDLARVLIRRARKLYANDSLSVELNNTVYALDSSTIDLRLSVFDWAPFRSSQGRRQAAHAAGPARLDPRVHPCQRRQAARCQCAGHPARGGWGLLRDGSWLRGLRALVCDASGRCVLRHPRQGGHGCAARVLARRHCI